MKRDHLLKGDALVNISYLLEDLMKGLNATLAPEGYYALCKSLRDEQSYPDGAYADGVVLELRSVRRAWGRYKREFKDLCDQAVQTPLIDQALEITTNIC